VGDEATLLYGESGVSSVTRVAAVTAVAAVDIDELVSFRAGGEVPSDETWFSGIVFEPAWFWGLGGR
jgi:hypothetical protein